MTTHQSKQDHNSLGYGNGGSEHERLDRLERRIRLVMWAAVGLGVIAVTLAYMIAYMLLPRHLWW